MEIADVYENLPALETERLKLRKLTMDDAQNLFEYASEPRVSKFVPWPTHETILNSKDFIQMALKNYESAKLAPWAIALKESNKLIGTIDFVKWLPKHYRAEVGYVLSHKYWGQGFTLEAATRVIQFGFEKMDLHRIEASFIVENVQSQRVLQKLGMTFEGISREQFFIKDRFVDLVHYAILKEEYEKSGPR